MIVGVEPLQKNDVISNYDNYDRKLWLGRDDLCKRSLRIHLDVVTHQFNFHLYQFVKKLQ